MADSLTDACVARRWGSAVRSRSVRNPFLRPVTLSNRHGGRATAGLYAYQGVEIFVAWGYLDERHCRFHAFRSADGDWEPPQPGCPRVRAQPGGGLRLRTGNGVRELPPGQSVWTAVGSVAGEAARRTAASENPVSTSAPRNVAACTTGLTAGTKPITATGS